MLHATRYTFQKPAPIDGLYFSAAGFWYVYHAYHAPDSSGRLVPDSGAD